MRPSPPARTAVERKVHSGWASVSKKSAERMWASRCSWLVSMELASMVTSTLEVSRVSPVVMTPLKVPKRPFTLLTIMWRTLKEMSECDASMSQTPAM